MPDEIATSELEWLKTPIIDTSTLPTSTGDVNSGGFLPGPGEDSLIDELISSSSATTTDYSGIAAIFYLGCFLILLFTLMHRLSSPQHK